MKRQYDDYLDDMLDNAEKAISFVDGMDYDGFCKDDKAMYAVYALSKLLGKPHGKFLTMFVKPTQKSNGGKLLP